MPQINLPANLPENWTPGQIVAPTGQEAGLSTQHGYNYLMKQVNDAQRALNNLNSSQMLYGKSDLQTIEDALDNVIAGVSSLKEKLEDIPDSFDADAISQTAITDEEGEPLSVDGALGSLSTSLVQIEKDKLNAKDAPTANLPTVTQEEAESGISGDIKAWSPQRVAQAIAALASGGGGSEAETGVWTPTIIGSTNAGGFTYSGRTGVYIKTKYMCTVYAHVSITAINSAPTGSEVRITGLPFNPSNNDNFIGSAVASGVNLNNPILMVLPYQNYLRLTSQSLTSYPAFTPAMMGNTFNFFASVTYRTNS